jgi:hypothetical protein
VTVSAPADLARKAVDELPETIRIGGFDFAIVKWPSASAMASNRFGEFSSVEQIIRIQRDFATRYKAADTLLHEITHAIFWVYGIGKDDDEERICAAMGSAWMQIHRDNIWLGGWLLNTLSDTAQRDEWIPA